MRTDRRLLVVLGAGAVVWLVVLALASLSSGLIDLQVYRAGGTVWLRGFRLYHDSFPAPLSGPDLPFTYPPVAAALFAGLAVLPWRAAATVLAVSGFAALVLACWLAAVRLSARSAPYLRLDRSRAALLAAAAVTVAPLLEPVRENLSFGQVNLVLFGLVVADCLLPRTPWPRGTLIGLAAAIKLTPAAFVLFFLAHRQWRPVVAAAAAFCSAGLLGLLLAPADSLEYWFGVLLDPGRVGGLAFAPNQSLHAVLDRSGLPAGLGSAAWLLLCVAVGVLALSGVAALRRRGDDVAALLVVAAAALLVSPVSWSHHWVWAVLGLLWLAERADRARTAANVALLAGTAAVFVAAPFWWLPNRAGRELHWSPGQQLLGNAYVWVALTVVIAGALVAARATAGVRFDRGESWEPVDAVVAGVRAGRIS